MSPPKILGTIWYYAQRPLLITLIVILAVLGSKYTLAAADIEAEGHYMFRVLHAQQGYPMPVSYPVYHIGFTEDSPASCYHAILCYKAGHVWASTQWVVMNERDRLATLLHEDVHHLQWEKQGNAMNCQQNWLREEEAYKAQKIYLSENYQRTTTFVLPPICRPEQGGAR